MTTEEKAKAYDKALESARVLYKDEDKHIKATLIRVFPELKESEDERVRKALIQAGYEWDEDKKELKKICETELGEEDEMESKHTFNFFILQKTKLK